MAEYDVAEMQLLLSDKPVLGLPDVTTDTVCPGCYKVAILFMCDSYTYNHKLL